MRLWLGLPPVPFTCPRRCLCVSLSHTHSYLLMLTNYLLLENHAPRASEEGILFSLLCPQAAHHTPSVPPEPPVVPPALVGQLGACGALPPVEPAGRDFPERAERPHRVQKQRSPPRSPVSAVAAVDVDAVMFVMHREKGAFGPCPRL